MTTRPRFALLFLAIVALTMQCNPRLPPVSGCAPRAMSCRDGAPFVCSGSQRWEPAGDTTCASVGGACEVSDAGVALCAPVRDGGSDAHD